MAGISFSVFKDKILSGAKRQTIRTIRKNPIKEGETLYMWWKQRSPEREKLGETNCIKISHVEIHNDCYLIDQDVPTKGCGQVICDSTKMHELAIADGFDNWQQLIEFFENTHSLPFEGVLIEWDSIKRLF